MTRCVTPRQTCPWPNGFRRNLRSKTRWFTGFCNSHQVSHFATFFIDARAEISVAESRFSLERSLPQSPYPRERERTDLALVRVFLGASRAGGLLGTRARCPGAVRSQPCEGKSLHLILSRVCELVREWYCYAGFDNDPSAGSPTETLLRLLLPLNDKVQWTSQDVAGSEPPTSPRSEHFTGSFNR